MHEQEQRDRNREMYYQRGNEALPKPRMASDRKKAHNDLVLRSWRNL